VEASGSTARIRHLDDHISHFLRDCRSCRRDDGECSIEDGYRALFFDDFLPAEAVVFCTPIYWYGMSAQTKAFFDRSFCYYAASYPASQAVVEQMQGKRLGLVLASEETYPGAELGIVHQIQEFSRYTRSRFVGCARGVGNSRAEVTKDPNDPIAAARRLGAEIFSRSYSDYHLDTPRSARVWE
jgi:multimeric flavodoxin WrbA